MIACLSLFGVKSATAQQSPEAAELQLLKQQVAELMKERQEDKARISTMESQVKAMGAQVALSASVAKSKTLTGPDGKEISLEGGPVVIPPIETFTRNLKYHWYGRPGIGFTGNGVAQTASFQVPGIGHGRFRLGNENDNYFEFGFIGTNLLGDPDPDVIDAKFRFTLAGINAVDKSSFVATENKGWNWATRNAYVEFKNVIKSAPAVAFWAGQRYYDTYDIHSQDYGYLDNSGYGGGAYDIDVGIGKLAVAYFGSIRAGTGNFLRNDFNEFNLQVNGGQGNFYVHLLDIRLGEVALLGGKFKFVLNGAYMHGGNFTITPDSGGAQGQGHVDNSGGAGGGFIYQYDLPKNWGPGSFVQIAALYGWGLVQFSGADTQVFKLSDAYNSALVADDNAAFGTFEDVNPNNNSQRAKANAQFVWNPKDNFSLNVWTTYQFDDQGFTSYRVDNGSVSSTSGDAHVFTFGIRPVYWIWGPFAIQGQAGYSYISNVRQGAAGFGDGGSLGIFTIAPTIKPRGGFFTRPELRLYATFAVWSDSLRGAIGGPYYSNSTYGWNFGIQAETWF